MKKLNLSNIFGKNGRKIPNQFLIQSEEGDYFQSYNSMIVFRDNSGNVFLDEKYWKYSPTTSMYRSIFLGEDTKTTERKIKTGEYQLVNLNN